MDEHANLRKQARQVSIQTFFSPQRHSRPVRYVEEKADVEHAMDTLQTGNLESSRQVVDVDRAPLQKDDDVIQETYIEPPSMTQLQDSCDDKDKIACNPGSSELCSPEIIDLVGEIDDPAADLTAQVSNNGMSPGRKDTKGSVDVSRLSYVHNISSPIPTKAVHVVIDAGNVPPVESRCCKDPGQSLEDLSTPIRSPEMQAEVTVQLDPIIKKRIDAYNNKISDLINLCSRLFHTNSTDDSEQLKMLQNVYGLGKDQDLEVHDAGHDLRMERFKMLNDIRQKIVGRSDVANEPVLIQCPSELRSFFAQFVQGKPSTLSTVARGILKQINPTCRSKVSVENPELLLWLEMEIKMVAQRQSYGYRPPKANIFEDASAGALWLWESGNLEHFFSPESQRIIREMRKRRRRLGSQLKTLKRVVYYLHQTPVDEVKVSSEEAKAAKYIHAIESEMQRWKDRGQKENTRQIQKAMRDQQENERRKKRELEMDNKKSLANKRKKSLISYFKSIDSSATDQDISNENHVCESARMMESEKSPQSSQSILSTRAMIDDAVPWLHALYPRNDHVAEPTVLPSNSVSRNWSCQRRRHAKLGVLKLLQFTENFRPAYYGTFSKKSQALRRGRRPFAHCQNIDYSVDSDEEWEEEEPGESLSDESEHDSDEEENCLDYGDSWLAYDDEVDYMDDENRIESDTDAKKAKADSHKLLGPSAHPSKNTLKKLVIKVEGPYFCDGGNETHGTAGSCPFRNRSQSGRLLCTPNFESARLRIAKEMDQNMEL